MSSFLSNIFSGGAERQAANANRAAYGQYGRDANGSLDTGLTRSSGALTDANNSAGNYLGRNFGLYGDLGNSGGDIIGRGTAGRLGALSGDERFGTVSFRDPGQYYDPLSALGTKYGKATGLYQDSLGVNGAAGNANAVNAFHAGPGYQFSLDQGIEALNRRRNAAGMLNSGNADTDAIKFGTGLANQEFGGWQDRLARFVNPELSATSGAASGRAAAASGLNSLDLQQQQQLNQQLNQQRMTLAQLRSGVIGNDTAARLGLAGAVTQGQAGVNNAQAANATALGNGLSGLYNQDAQNRVNVAGTVTGGNVSANNLQAQGEAQGSRNLLNAGLGLATLVAGMGGGGGSFGSLLGGGSGGLGNASRTSTFGFNPLSGAFSGL